MFDSIDTLSLALAVNTEMIAAMEIRADRRRAAASDPMLLATDLADHLVRTGVPFRHAHELVGKAVGEAIRTATPLDQLDLSSVDSAFADVPRELFSLDHALASRTTTGSPAPERVNAEIARWNSRL